MECGVLGRGVGHGLLHGRLGSDEKAAALHAFASGETQVLISTTVVEVRLACACAGMCTDLFTCRPSSPHRGRGAPPGCLSPSSIAESHTIRGLISPTMVGARHSPALAFISCIACIMTGDALPAVAPVSVFGIDLHASCTVNLMPVTAAADLFTWSSCRRQSRSRQIERKSDAVALSRLL